MEETSEISEIVTKLKSRDFRLIAIDGVDGSGKSRLASKLANKLGYVHINLDDYLEKHRGGFLGHIKYELLKIKMENIKLPVIIEGVCLLAVLRNLKKDPDLLIYIKRMSDDGWWRDEAICEVSEDIDEFVSKEENDLKKFCELEAKMEGKKLDPEECKIPELREEIIRYHYEFRPHKKANIVFNLLTANKANAADS